MMRQPPDQPTIAEHPLAVGYLHHWTPRPRSEAIQEFRDLATRDGLTFVADSVRIHRRRDSRGRFLPGWRLDAKLMVDGQRIGWWENLGRR